MFGFIPHRARHECFVVTGQIVADLLEISGCSSAIGGKVLIDRDLRSAINRHNISVLINAGALHLIGCI